MITLVVRSASLVEIEAVHRILDRALDGSPAYMNRQITLAEVDQISSAGRRNELQSGRQHYQELHIGEQSNQEDIELEVTSQMIRGLTHHDLFAELFSQIRKSA